MDYYNIDNEYCTMLSPLIDDIIKICEEHKIPSILSFQVTPSVFYNTKLLFNNRTDERLYLASRIVETGDCRFVTVYDKSANDFVKLNNDNIQFLQTILDKLNDHDAQYQKYKEPAGLCRFDFAYLRKMIENRIMQQHFPSGE